MPPRPRPKASAPIQAPTAPAVPVQRAPIEEENIDLEEVSETSEDEDAPARARVIPDDDETTRVAPIVKPVVKSNRALDIDLLFDRGKGKPSVCKYCK
jgi:hypothetical protein